MTHNDASRVEPALAVDPSRSTPEPLLTPPSRSPVARRELTLEEQEIARLNRVLEMHLADERLLDWVGSSDARMAAVIETFYEDGGISLRRAIQSATEQKPEIPASAATETADPF